MRSLTRCFPVVLQLLIVSTAASAQFYPERPVTLIVPFAAGGPTDTLARLVAGSMAKTLGQQVPVENVGGAGGTLGAARVAKAAPDGYTLLLHNISQATSGTLYSDLPYDPVADFAPVGLIADVPMTIVARPDFPADDLAGLGRAPEGQSRPGVDGQRRDRGVVPLVRHAADLGERHVRGRGLLQGHGAGADRPAGRPDRPPVRPDHQHDGPHPGGHAQGVRGDDQGARAHAARPADHRRGRPAGGRDRGLARHLRAGRDAARRRRRAGRGAARGAGGPGHGRPPDRARRHAGVGRPGDPGGAQGAPRRRDREVGTDPPRGGVQAN